MMASKRPPAVFTSASEIPWASEVALTTPPAPAVAWKARIMPMVVPKSPVIVAMEAMVDMAIKFRSKSGTSNALASSMARWVSASRFSEVEFPSSCW